MLYVLLVMNNCFVHCRQEIGGDRGPPRRTSLRVPTCAETALMKVIVEQRHKRIDFNEKKNYN